MRNSFYARPKRALILRAKLDESVLLMTLLTVILEDQRENDGLDVMTVRTIDL